MLFRSFGNYKSPEIVNDKHLKKISKLIKDVEFIHSDFEDSFENIKNNDFIYADPPYVPENAKSFVGYTSDGFNLEKHQVLFELCKDYNFVMSNSDTNLVKDSFNDKTKYNITKENEVVLYELIQSYGNISNKEISDKLKKNYNCPISENMVKEIRNSKFDSNLYDQILSYRNDNINY